VYRGQLLEVHRRDQRLQHHDKRMRAVPDQRHMFGGDTDLRYRNEHLSRLHGRERLHRIRRANRVRCQRRLRPMHGQQHLLGHHTHLRDHDECVPSLRSRQ
jgi:hypothetical protein